MLRKFLLSLLCMPLPALAATANLSFVPATTNVDGSSIPTTCPSGQTQCGRLVATVIEYGSCVAGTFGVKAGEITVAPPATAATVNMTVVQQYCFRAVHQNDYANRSGFSNVAVKDNPAPTPQAPVLSVAAVVSGVPVSPAFVVLASGARSTAVAGFVAVGAPVVSAPVFSYRGRTYCRVAPTNVRWWATTSTTEVAAPCA